MSTQTPLAITRFLEAEQSGDFAALAACFRVYGVVLDEGATHIGRAAIEAWRRKAAGVEFTAEVTAMRRLGPGGFRVVQHLEGKFPGGVADLDYNFAIERDQVAALMIFQQARNPSCGE